MKIAIFDPYPRVCGVTTTRLVLLDAFRNLGHEADLVTCTKSGKAPCYWGIDSNHKHYKNGRMAEWGVRWFDGMPDKIFRADEMGSELNTYDAILLAEPKCPMLDKGAEKRLDWPDYYWALKETKTPWITCCFSSQYSETQAIFAEDLLKLPNFSGFVAIRECHLKSLQDRDLVGDKPVKFIGVHPYRVRNAPDAPVPTKKALGFIGRVVPNKGVTVLTDAIPDLDDSWEIEIHGSTSIGMGGCATLFIADHLKSLGYEISYGAVNKKDRAEVLRPFPWVATKKGAPRVEYFGGYMRGDVLNVCNRFAVNVSCTSSEFQQEQIESTGMEAMDAGCIGLHPDHQLIAAPYKAVDIPGFTKPPSYKKPFEFHEELMNAIYLAEEIIGTDTHRQWAAENRKILKELHSPERIAEVFVELMMEARS